MSERGTDSDSDAPEEFSLQQAMQQDEAITKIQNENKARVVREGKERRRKWAQKLTPRSLPKKKTTEDDKEAETETKRKTAEDDKEIETETETQGNSGMLPDDIVKILAANEKIVFTSDSEDENVEEKPTKKRRKSKKSGLEPVILKKIRGDLCAESSLEFLKKRKMQVPRSSAVLNNSKQALRLISTSGLLK